MDRLACRTCNRCSDHHRSRRFHLLGWRVP